mmetsp:Transcript_2529/g.7476  ORF Transcript_2529/g.7476 Transcript_2529/m.7476 type:complete len:379 (-) Transcript_2529:101-1237(-)
MGSQTVIAALVALVVQHVQAVAPMSGAPFLFSAPIDFDRIKPGLGLKITRLKPPTKEDATIGCHDGDQASKDKCLTDPGPGCMWTQVETDDPTLMVQASNSFCLPCELDGEELPCWSLGAWFGNMIVKECIMSCGHQKTMAQPYASCAAGPGGGSESECFDRGQGSGSKCMFLVSKDKTGQLKSQCGPCELPGTGSWGCPAEGDKGLDDQTVVRCKSQCDKPCSGPPDCAPTAFPPPVLPANPGIPRVASPKEEMLSAPLGGDSPPPNPMAIVQAAILAAAAAGHPFTTPAPPKTYYPVVMYRTPADYLATTLPPMTPYQYVWPQAWPGSVPMYWPDYVDETTGTEPSAAAGAAFLQKAQPLLAKKKFKGLSATSLQP